MTISGFVAYVKQLWKNKPDASTPLSAERLLHMEAGIKGNSDAIEKLAAAVVNQIVNDPNKIAGMAALFAVNEKVTKLNSDLSTVNGKLTTESGIITNGELGTAEANWHRFGNIVVFGGFIRKIENAESAWKNIGGLKYEAIGNIPFRALIGATGEQIIARDAQVTGKNLSSWISSSDNGKYVFFAGAYVCK